MSQRDSNPQIVIAPQSLRDHGTPERVDRIWERLERNLSLDEAPAPAATARRWPIVSLAAAASFALGVGVTAWAIGDRTPTSVVMAPAETMSPTDVFAAGSAPRSYPLQGGGTLTLEPGTIVDTVERRGDTLTLRLIRGEATVSTATTSSQIALLVGGAELHPAGQMRVRHDGDTAYLRVLDGSASVRAPDAERGEQSLVLGPDQEATVPVRVVTASVAHQDQMVAQHDAEALRSSPDASAVPLLEEGPPLAIAVSDGDAHKAAWIAACRVGDDLKAAELAAQEGADALAAVDDPALLLCLSSGQELLKNTAGAVALAERVVTEYEQRDPRRAMAAANDLARLYDKLGQPDKAAFYRQKRQELSNGSLLTERALCQKIEGEAAAGNSDEVRRFGQLYMSQFPNGPCSSTVERLLAQHAAPEGGAPDGAEDDEASDEADGKGEPPKEQADDGPYDGD